jgi:hypothetical protein
MTRVPANERILHNLGGIGIDAIYASIIRTPYSTSFCD